jgi:23S rRNA (uracil1939-C5)-methyltransferase
VSETLVITHVGHRGDGIAETAGGAVFIPYTLPDETVEAVEVSGHPDRRSLLRVDISSPDRVSPFCPHFGICGGCATQHWADAPYRAWKRDLVVTALAQAGIDASVDDLIDAHGEGRRRAVLHARHGAKDILEVGFSALRAHTIIPIDVCPVLSPSMAGTIPAAWAIAEALAPLRKPLDIHATATLNGLDIDVRGSGELRTAQTGALARIAEKHALTRITRHGEMVTQRAAPVVKIGRAMLTLPPGSFLQATQAGEDMLARLVADHAGKSKIIADLFCGVGPFALRLAENAKVTAMDSDEGAIEALSRAGSATPGLKAVAAQKRDLFRRPLTAPELKPFDAVIVDPPRQGANAQARELAKSKVPLVISVSCNAATFARDAKILIDGGYKLSAVTPVDQFKYTAHVEIVARFSR